MQLIATNAMHSIHTTNKQMQLMLQEKQDNTGMQAFSAMVLNQKRNRQTNKQPNKDKSSTQHINKASPLPGTTLFYL